MGGEFAPSASRAMCQSASCSRQPSEFKVGHCAGPIAEGTAKPILLELHPPPAIRLLSESVGSIHRAFGYPTQKMTILLGCEMPKRTPSY
jgi:hypothetical protein